MMERGPARHRKHVERPRPSGKHPGFLRDSASVMQNCEICESVSPARTGRLRRVKDMLPKLRFVIATIGIALALMALAAGLFSASRTGSVFAIGLRSAQGSPIERSLPEPPDLRQVMARTAMRRSEELDRLLDLPPPAAALTEPPASADAATETAPTQAMATPELSTQAEASAQMPAAPVQVEPPAPVRGEIDV